MFFLFVSFLFFLKKKVLRRFILSCGEFNVSENNENKIYRSASVCEWKKRRRRKRVEKGHINLWLAVRPKKYRLSVKKGKIISIKCFDLFFKMKNSSISGFLNHTLAKIMIFSLFSTWLGKGYEFLINWTLLFFELLLRKL